MQTCSECLSSLFPRSADHVVYSMSFRNSPVHPKNGRYADHCGLSVHVCVASVTQIAPKTESAFLPSVERQRQAKREKGIGEKEGGGEGERERREESAKAKEEEGKEKETEREKRHRVVPSRL